MERNRVINALVAIGDNNELPLATVRTASSRSSARIPLPMKPLAPARIDCATCSSTSKVVRINTRTSVKSG